VLHVIKLEGLDNGAEPDGPAGSAGTVGTAEQSGS
jgi:hypothetical protein